MTGAAPGTGPTDAQRAEAIRDRLSALEIQHLDLLADESVPGRKHRLDAVRAARHDLESELAGLTDDGPPRPVVQPAGR